MLKMIDKNFKVLNEVFAIVQNEDGFYLAINHKDLDGFGCLKRKLNGIQMHASKTEQGCKDGATDHTHIQHLMKEKNIDVMQAMRIYYKMA